MSRMLRPNTPKQDEAPPVLMCPVCGAVDPVLDVDVTDGLALADNTCQRGHWYQYEWRAAQ